MATAAPYSAPGRASAPRKGTAFSPSLSLGFFIALIAPALISAWEFQPVGVGLAVLAVPALLTWRLLAIGRRRAFPHPGMIFLFTAMVLITIASFLVANSVGSVVAEQSGKLILLFLLVLLGPTTFAFTARSFRGGSSVSVIIQSLYVACVAICAIELLMLALGITSRFAEAAPQAGDQASFLALLGLDYKRTALPLASGFQAGAVAPLVATVIALARVRTLRGFWNIGFFVIGLIPILMLDARQFVVAVFATMLLTNRTVPAWGVATGAALAPCVAPFIALFARGVLPTELRIGIMRGAGGGMLNGREYIWTYFWNYIRQDDLGTILFGHGMYGQVATGLSSRYAYMFKEWETVTGKIAPLHNSYFQIVIDSGLVGLIVWAALLWLGVYHAVRLSRAPVRDAVAWRAAAMILIAVCVVGSSEVILCLYMKEAVTVILPILAMIMVDAGQSRRAYRPIPPGDQSNIRQPSRP